jgi:hypothetical protein
MAVAMTVLVVLYYARDIMVQLNVIR